MAGPRTPQNIEVLIGRLEKHYRSTQSQEIKNVIERLEKRYPVVTHSPEQLAVVERLQKQHNYQHNMPKTPNYGRSYFQRRKAQYHAWKEERREQRTLRNIVATQKRAQSVNPINYQDNQPRKTPKDWRPLQKAENKRLLNTLGLKTTSKHPTYHFHNQTERTQHINDLLTSQHTNRTEHLQISFFKRLGNSIRNYIQREPQFAY